MLKWKRRVVGFTEMAKKRSSTVLLLFGGDRVEKLENIVVGKAVGELSLFQVKWTIRKYLDLREFVSVAT